MTTVQRRSPRRVPSPAGIFAAALAAVAGLAFGDEQPSPASTEAGKAAVRPPTAVVNLPDPPARPGSTSPALAAEGATTVTKDHEILVTWLEPGETAGRLKFARLSGRAWSPPVTVADGVSTLDPTDRPSLTVIDTQGVRRTLIARTGDVVARSGDAGRTWTRLPAPALPFASFAGGDEGAYVFWLDDAGSGPARLLGTRVLAGETVLDPRVDGGAGTSAAMTWDGPVVVYRDESDSGARDVNVVRRQDARWTEPRTVYAEDARPGLQSHPRVAALRRHVAVVWSATAEPRPLLRVAFSDDAGRTFGKPVVVDAGETLAADVALDDAGHALILWQTAGTSGARLHLTRVSTDGRRGAELVLAKGLDPGAAGIPQIARAGARVAATWIEGPSRRLRAVAVPLAAIPAPEGSPGAPLVPVRAARVHSGRGRVGESVPDVEVASLDGGEVSLPALRGQAVLLNLWATWCLPCLAEMPELARLHERYRERGLVVVGLSIDAADAADRVRAFVAEKKLPFAVWLDPEMQIHDALRVRSLPATFVIDREGRIVARRERAIKTGDAELAKALNRALGEP